MLENLTVGFSQVANLANLAAIFGGVLVGTVVGAIPGLGAAIAVALALPFTFYMNPITGILLLVGLYKGATYGGSITAILINTPGTPAAACTVLDGYPMARRGEAGKALNMALYASCIADFVSNLALIFFTGWIASFALRFGPPEFFTLMCFSVTIIASVSGASLIKGLISGVFGLMLATIGLDFAYTTERMTFGSTEMMAGMPLIPVLIGLFALPEVISEFAKRPMVQERVADIGRSIVTRAELLRCLPTIVRGSLIGVIIGAIPGTGAAPAAFISYSEAKRASKNRDNFGKGEIEGIAAAESGNNGVCGATMIPLLSLGVPGDVVTAIMLGAFMVHGLQPGPLLFESNAGTVYAIYLGILASSILLFVAGKLCIRLAAPIADIHPSVLHPAIVAFCVIGAFVVNGAVFDLLIMSIMGVVGFAMLRLEIPPAPFLIAFVLGPLFEENLRRALLISKGDPAILWRGPICWFFLALTVLSIVLAVYRARQDIRRHLSD